VQGRREARGGTLILGGGFAGAWVARRLGKAGATIVGPDNFMLFTPMLPEAASGTLEPRHAVVPLRMMCPHAELILGRAAALDEAAREVTVEADVGTVTVDYEQLVLAIAPRPRGFPSSARSRTPRRWARRRGAAAGKGVAVEGARGGRRVVSGGWSGRRR
jgi:NADH dehydrogenase